MKIKISTGFSGVIATGSYQNARPSYTAEVEFEKEGTAKNEIVLALIDEYQKALQEICYRNFKQDEQTQTIERIQKERKDFRIYQGGFPSVTSILNWDADFWVTAIELQQYASQGQLIHAQVAEYIKTGEWRPVEKIDGTWSDLVVVKKGELQLPISGWSFPDFLKKYPVEKMVCGESITSKEHKFGGTPDIKVCYYGGKKTLADVKRTANKLKDFKQIAAYIIAEEENGESPYEQMMVIVLNDKTQQGFSKPIIST
ncbi:unnamed protein product, partial [marine sediment metagenome]